MLIIVYLIGIINYLLLFNPMTLLKFESSNVNNISLFINHTHYRSIYVDNMK